MPIGSLSCRFSHSAVGFYSFPSHAIVEVHQYSGQKLSQSIRRDIINECNVHRRTSFVCCNHDPSGGRGHAWLRQQALRPTKNPHPHRCIIYASHTRSAHPGRVWICGGGAWPRPQFPPWALAPISALAPITGGVFMLGPEPTNRADARPPYEKTYLHGALDGSRVDDPPSNFLSLIQAGGRSASGHQQSTLFAPTASFHMYLPRCHDCLPV